MVPQEIDSVFPWFQILEDVMADEKSFGSSVLDFIDRVAESGKKGFMAAGEAISDFGDKSVVRIELGQLKSKLLKAYADLGKNVYEKIEVQKMSEIPVGEDLNLSAIVDSIRKIEADIKKHEESLEKSKKEKKTSGKTEGESGEGEKESSAPTEQPESAASESTSSEA